METLNPPSFLCGVRLPGGINKNGHVRVSSCTVAMVTAINHADLNIILLNGKILPLKNKNKLVTMN